MHNVPKQLSEVSIRDITIVNVSPQKLSCHLIALYAQYLVYNLIYHL